MGGRFPDVNPWCQLMVTLPPGDTVTRRECHDLPKLGGVGMPPSLGRIRRNVEQISFLCVVYYEHYDARYCHLFYITRIMVRFMI
jgi:hypothetical protein